MNSDTSQEILRYQKEWAKQFHEQVGITNAHQKLVQNRIKEYAENQACYVQEEIKSGCGAPSSALTGGNSSQMIYYKNEESHEQIAILPESALTNNMQNLNANSKK